MGKFALAWGSLSLRARIIFSSIICILLPLIFSFILMNYLIQDELVKRAVNQSEDSLSVLDIQMTTYVDDFLYLSNFIAFNDQIKSVLNRNIKRSESGVTITPESRALDYIEISRNLEEVTNLLAPSFLTIVLENGFIYTNYPVVRAAEMNWLEMYQENKDDEYFGFNWIGVHTNHIESYDDHSYLISIRKNIKLSEKSNALLGISIDEKPIRSLLNETAFSPEQELMVVDFNGKILSHNNEVQIEKTFQYSEELKGDGSFHVVEKNNNDYLMVSRAFSYGDLKLVSLIPYSTAIGNIQVVTGNILGLLILFFLFFLIVLIMLVRVLTNPITSLNTVIKEVKKGNLKVRSGIKGKGDIEQLGDSLDSMLDRIEQMIKQIKIVEKNKRKAELEMLQAQINPHFLFNILNSLRLKILLNGDGESAKLIQSLSMLLRMTITRNNEFVSLEKEIELIEHYLKLMNFRSFSNIKFEKDIDQKTLPIMVPRFFLQPLIENSINHGFEQKSGMIKITSKMEEDRLLIRVTDNGKGFTQEELQLLRDDLKTAGTSDSMKRRQKHSFTGIGIRNVFQRMNLIYEDQFQMGIDNQETGGTQITFYIQNFNIPKN